MYGVDRYGCDAINGNWFSILWKMKTNFWTCELQNIGIKVCKNMLVSYINRILEVDLPISLEI